MGARWTVMTGGAAVGGRRGKRGEEGRKRWVVMVASKKEGYVSEGEGRWKKKKKMERRQRKTMTTTMTTTTYLTWWGVRAATGGGGAAGVGRVIGGCRSFLGMPLLMMTIMRKRRRRRRRGTIKLITNKSMYRTVCCIYVGMLY
jgi:hypothetical protein